MKRWFDKLTIPSGVEGMKRRDFLANSFAAASGLLLGSKLALAATETVNEPNLINAPGKTFDPWEIVSLGKTGLKVTRVGAGTGMQGVWRSPGQAENLKTLLRQSFDHGCRFFDTADTYGSHPYIIPALKGIPRENYTIVSKLMTWAPLEDEREKPIATVDRFLKELNTDYIDLLLLQCMIAPDWNKTLKPYMDGLSQAKEQKKVRALGVSCFSIDALKTAAEEGWGEAVYAKINATGADMDGSPDEVVPILKKIHDAGKAVLGTNLIASGPFRSNRQMRVNIADFVLNLGCVDSVIVNFESLDEISDFESILRETTRKSAG